MQKVHGLVYLKSEFFDREMHLDSDRKPRVLPGERYLLEVELDNRVDYLIKDRNGNHLRVSKNMIARTPGEI